MILDSGTMYICTLENVAENGKEPHQVLKPINKHWYQERTIGMNRQYLAKGVNERIDLLAYIHYDYKVRIGMYVVIGDLDGNEQMRIDDISHVIEENTNLRYTVITCHRLDELYDVYREQD